MNISAPAKINLSLEITGRRPDGYHEIVSVMQTVSLADRLFLEPAEELTVAVCGADLPSDNLVLRAAELLRMHCGARRGCAIRLEKHIPIAAGLGGGSSDAAATLLGLTRYWGLNLDTERLLPLAAALGSDVPFFLCGGTSLVEGRGERVRPLPRPAPCWYLLVNPRVPVSTAEVYANLRREEWTDGAETRRIAAELDVRRCVPPGYNTLAPAVFRVSPEARTCFEAVMAVASGGVQVSGSGPTVFAPFSSSEAAEAAAARLKQRGYWTAVARTLVPSQESTPCA